jgi:hypothetical protein
LRIVRGIKRNPANARAKAPERRFAVFESFGSEDEDVYRPAAEVDAATARGAACCRMVLRVVK